MTVSVFVGTSVDGFIARPNGEFDFLPAGGGEPHGYEEFMASVDALVIGRNTFETVLQFDPWPYGKKRVVVLSSRPVDLSAVRGGIVEQMKRGIPSPMSTGTRVIMRRCVRLHHVATRHYASGLVQSEYQVTG
jgi:hypothetical protein